ncbi:MAG TPA: type II secretion system F family protein [Tepidisphaeraceae bacterium]|jgi:type II secretory pathway component PulF|nr:type II secretion system F family protein [Tepidisphaeraceae bacterium]
MKFSYKAIDRSGEVVNATIDAADANDAMDTLRRQGVFVSEITEASASQVKAGDPTRHRVSSGKRLRHLVNFTRQIAVLVSSGTPLVQALVALERQAMDPQWRAVLEKLRTLVEEGASLSAAMEQFPQYFDPICRSLVSAGESSGKLEPMLDRLAKLVRKQMQIRGAITGAMVYPSLLIVIAMGVMVVMLTFVLPRFAGLFTTLDTPLPPTTKFVMLMSDAVRGYWWAILIALAAAGAGLKFWLASAAGKIAFDRAAVNAPIFGSIVRSFATARIARLIGVQIDSHVPLLEALALTKNATSNSLYIQLIADAEDAATHGQPISTAFVGSPLVNPSVAEAIRSGEQTGQVASLLLNIADFLDDENDTTVRSLTSIIEPIILIALGAIVGFMAISMFLPLFDLTSAVQGGGGG